MRGVIPAGPGLVVQTNQASLLEQHTAVFSDCGTYRYALTRRWDEDRPPAVFVMLNPSTASAFTDDPTIRRCVGFARSYGCGGLVVLNLFALRSTQPAALLTADDPVGPANDQLLRLTLQAPDRLVVAAWGTHGTHLGRDQAVTAMVAQLGVQLHCLGLTKGQHPRHPLYVRGDAKLAPWAGRAG